MSSASMDSSGPGTSEQSINQVKLEPASCAQEIDTGTFVLLQAIRTEVVAVKEEVGVQDDFLVMSFNRSVF